MGFWGIFLVARADRPLPDLDGVRDLADHIVWHGMGRDGWQAVQLHRAPEVLDGGDVFVVGQFFKLLAALGLPALTGAGTAPG
jgi:hypothetical protein